jgi:hypothetical protein
MAEDSTPATTERRFPRAWPSYLPQRRREAALPALRQPHRRRVAAVALPGVSSNVVA